MGECVTTNATEAPLQLRLENDDLVYLGGHQATEPYVATRTFFGLRDVSD